MSKIKRHLLPKHKRDSGMGKVAIKKFCKRFRKPGESMKSCMRYAASRLGKRHREPKIKSCSAKDPAVRKMIETARWTYQQLRAGEISDTNGRADSAIYGLEASEDWLRKRCGRKSKGIIKKMRA